MFLSPRLLALLLPIGFLGMTVLVLYMVKQAAVNIRCGKYDMIRTYMTEVKIRSATTV